VEAVVVVVVVVVVSVFAVVSDFTLAGCSQAAGLVIIRLSIVRVGLRTNWCLRVANVCDTGHSSDNFRLCRTVYRDRCVLSSVFGTLPACARSATSPYCGSE